MFASSEVCQSRKYSLPRRQNLPELQKKLSHNEFEKVNSFAPEKHCRAYACREASGKKGRDDL